MTLSSPPSIDTLSRPSVTHDPVRRVPAWVIPLGIAAGFALLFIALFRDRLLPAPDVEVAVVLATISEAAPSAAATAPAKTGGGEMLFQASGWIEPDPLPSKATALIDGVVEAVHVLEGQDVRKGDKLASLISDDMRLALSSAERNHDTLVATRDAHLAAIESARKKSSGAQAAAISAETLRNEAVDRLTRLKGMSARAFPEQEIVSARLRVEREEAQKLVADSAAAEAEAEIARLELETRVRENEIRAAAIEVEKARL
ncbi:MAG: biotin/lipoyl-binding protein, partial [Verrucomicrobiaceae bacterium]